MLMFLRQVVVVILFFCGLTAATLITCWAICLVNVVNAPIGREGLIVQHAHHFWWVVLFLPALWLAKSKTIVNLLDWLLNFLIGDDSMRRTSITIYAIAIFVFLFTFNSTIQIYGLVIALAMILIGMLINRYRLKVNPPKSNQRHN